MLVAVFDEVERTLNVVGSGAQHSTLFKDLMWVASAGASCISEKIKLLHKRALGHEISCVLSMSVLKKGDVAQGFWAKSL